METRKNEIIVVHNTKYKEIKPYNDWRDIYFVCAASKGCINCYAIKTCAASYNFLNAYELQKV